MSEEKQASPSRLATFLRCKRLYYYTYIRKWQGEGSAIPLDFGRAWGLAMDAIWSGADEEEACGTFRHHWVSECGHPTTISGENIRLYGQRRLVYAEDNLRWYAKHFAKSRYADMKVEGVEEVFAVPVPGTDWFLSGKFDKRVRDHDGKAVIIEHKHTGVGGKSGISMDMIKTWRIGLQIKIYSYAARFKYGESASVVTDVTKIGSQVYHQFVVHDRPHTEAVDLWEIIDTVDTIDRYTAMLEHIPAFPRNPESCYSFGRICPFYAVCMNVLDPSKLPDDFMGKRE